MTKKLIPIRQAILATLAFGFLAASVALFFVEPDIARPFFERPFNIYRVTIISLAVIFLLLATSSSWLRTDRSTNSRVWEIFPADTPHWLRIAGVALPLLAIVFTVLQLVNPEFAAILVRKENWPYYRPAIFVKCAFELVGMVAFIITAIRYTRKRQWLAVVLAGLAAIVLFLMAGEELSWGQRIFGWGTPNHIAAWNEQGETNFHNYNTQLFQNTLYFGGWLLLVGIAFWRNTIAKLLKKAKPLSFLVNWLPPLSFVLIFAAGFGFADPLRSEAGLYYSSNLFITLATLILLVALVVKAVKNHSNQALWHSLIILAIYLFVMITNQFFSSVWNHNSGAVTEYLELYITFGLMSWALYVNKTTD